MVEWINYLEATTSSTMISLTPQNAQLRRRFPLFFLFISFSIIAPVLLYNIKGRRRRRKISYQGRSCVCGFHSMLIGPVSQYNDAQRGNLYIKELRPPITANDSPLAANNKI